MAALATTRAVEHAGSTIEAAELGGAWYVSIDGRESSRSFPTATHALDWARRRVTARNRRASQAERPTRECTGAWSFDEERSYYRRQHERELAWRQRLLAEHGLELELSPCPTCEGSGEFENADGRHVCWPCKGSGEMAGSREAGQ